MRMARLGRGELRWIGATAVQYWQVTPYDTAAAGRSRLDGRSAPVPVR